jgi:glyoxylase-like metal-dependent hydrolase (beta-lactamase superfamily II)
MKVRVLGCSGAIAKDCRTTSFLLDHDLLVDAGTGVGDLTLDEMAGVDHVLLTHSHLDHVAALPLMVDAIAARRTVPPIQIHALQGTIDALKAHIFNNTIWPDFSRIPTPAAPFISFHPLEVGQTLLLAGKHVEALPAVHTVPAGATRWPPERVAGYSPATRNRTRRYGPASTR